MKLGAGAIIVAVGLLILWLAVTGKLGNVENAWAALTNTMSDDLRSDLEKAKKAGTATATPPIVGNPLTLAPIPFPLLPSFN
jgi:hypothetical protein